MTRSDLTGQHEAITARQQAVWATGDFHEVGRQTMPLSETLVSAVDPRAGQRVLDVACGSGNAALVAARRNCKVSGIDYVSALIERARRRAEADGLDIDFRVGDAQALPYPDAHFDVVLSTIGVMFAPDQERAASELLRVCRPGGTIGLVAWTPDHFGGDFFAAHGRHAPPPPGLAPPVLWGTDARLDELLGRGTVSIRSERRRADILFAHSVEHAVDIYATYFGPTITAGASMPAAEQQALRDDIAEVVRRYNRATGGTVVLEAEYLLTIAQRS
jgi:SAM-dependent methyltransferase